jgi:hypothetical protein
VTFAPWLIRNAWLTGNPVFPLGYAWFGARQEVWTPQLAQLWERAHQVEPQHGSVRSRLVLLIRRVVLDGRLGPLTPLLAAGVLCCLGRSRWDAAWLAMLAVQVGVWIGCTHLYARFAAVLLIPLLLLAGRAADAGSNRGLRRLFGGALLAAVFLGHWQSWSLFAAELMPGGRPLRIQGMTEWMYQDEQLAELPAFLRSALPDGSRVLLVADAAVFYMPSNVDYAVVFSRNPFGEAVARAGSDAEIMAWLRERGYTHVVVNWSEMERLRRTYGFWEGIDVPLFERLQTAGLTVVKHFSAGDGRRYATCYAVEGPGRPR